MDVFKDGISPNAPIPKEISETLLKHIKRKVVPKGTILMHKGDVVKDGYFVRRGLLRSYTIDEKGKEHIFMFAPEGWIIGDVEAEIHGAPAVLFIDALEDSEVDAFGGNLYDEMKAKHPEILSGGFTKIFKRIAVLQRRVIMLMSAPAQERYEEFLKTYPQIAQRVSQKMIASYLGITPEALSKIRGDMARA